MICTLTLNPAIDYVAHLPELSPGSILRSHGESVFPGGKGINVSAVLKELGVESVATGFLAGFTGDAVERSLAERGIGCDFVHLSGGFTRINIKLRAAQETDINASGPDIADTDVQRLLGKLSRLGEGDTLVMAGSVPRSLSPDIYAQIMEHLDGRGVRFVVDAAGEALSSTLPFRPFLIKPNIAELGDIFGVRITDSDTAQRYGAILRERGAQNVLVSMGGDGALLLAGDGSSLSAPAHRGTAVNTVGAGDSMIAGFLAGYERTGDIAYALRLGCACGSATAFSEGLAAAGDIERLMRGVPPAAGEK